MESLKQGLNRFPIYALVLAVLAWFAWDFYDFLNSDTSAYATQKAQNESAVIQLKAIQKKKREMDEFEQRLAQRKFEMNEVLSKLTSMKASIPENLDLPLLIRSVHTEATRSGLIVEGIQPGQMVDRENYGEQDFSLNFRGAYIQVVVFLDKISNLQKILTVEDISLVPTGSVLSGTVELKGAMQIKAYRYIQSGADTIAERNALAQPQSSPGQTAPPTASPPQMAPAPQMPPQKSGGGP